MSDHTRNLQTLKNNLERAKSYALAKPTDWNLTKVADLTQAMTDYRRFMAGQIQRHEMCWTAIELTMDMPAWGTSGT